MFINVRGEWVIDEVTMSWSGEFTLPDPVCTFKCSVELLGAKFFRTFPHVLPEHTITNHRVEVTNIQLSRFNLPIVTMKYADTTVTNRSLRGNSAAFVLWKLKKFLDSSSTPPFDSSILKDLTGG